MSDLMTLDDFIEEECKTDKEFAEIYTSGYEEFMIGACLKELRLESGMTQQELADRLQTKKSVISRMENHSCDIRLSTLQKVAAVFGKKIRIAMV